MKPTPLERFTASAGYPTSRRFSRTLAQAFPRDHSCAVEHYRPPVRYAWLPWAAAGACGLVFMAWLAKHAF